MEKSKTDQGVRRMVIAKLAAEKSNEFFLAAERIRYRMLDCQQLIAESGQPDVMPGTELPVDLFLKEMVGRKHAPRIKLKPRKKGNQLWTESLRMAVYANLEIAFTQAGLIIGGNRAGQVEEIKKLLVWIGDAEDDLFIQTPPGFLKTANLLSRPGLLENRRKARFPVFQRIANSSPIDPGDLRKLKNWLEQDLEQPALSGLGRPEQSQKQAFAKVLAKFWTELTGRKPSKGHKTNFARFLEACWKSGFDRCDDPVSFKRILRHHV